MSDTQTMVRTEMVVNGISYFLAQHHDLGDLKQRIEAAHNSGKFVDFVVVGNRTVSVLISPGTTVVFSVETVEYDGRDTGDDSHPYGGDFDF